MARGESYQEGMLARPEEEEEGEQEVEEGEREKEGNGMTRRKSEVIEG